MNINQALDSVRNFLSDLRFTEKEDDTAISFTSFSLYQLGSMILTGKERDVYIKCLENLTEAISSQEKFSRRSIERLLQKAILETWSKDVALKKFSPEQVKKAVNWLRMELAATPKIYIVYLPILGLAPRSLPRTVGRIAFLPSDGKYVEAIKRPLRKMLKGEKKTKPPKGSLGHKMILDISQNFRGNVIAKVEVRAGDSESAEAKAVRECRRTVDGINYYADIFADQDQRACVSLLGERGQAVPLATRTNNRSANLICEYEGRLPARDDLKLIGFSLPYNKGVMSQLKLPEANSEQSVKSGLDRLSELLVRNDRDPLNERILASMQWAGRATVNMRLEEAFLLYMIALESLVLGKDAKSEITYQLRLRAAHLIRNTMEERRMLLNRLSHLYGIRSQIVHRGSFQVTHSEVREARQYTKQALWNVLNEEPFKNMRTEEEFENWFLEKIIS